MCVTAILTEAERKRQDRSVHCAEERGRQARMMWIRGLIRTVLAASAAMCASMNAKCLIYAPDQAILTPNGMPLGECQVELLARAPAVNGHSTIFFMRCTMIQQRLSAQRKISGTMRRIAAMALVCLLAALPMAGTVKAQTVESRIVSLDTHPNLRSGKMAEAWRIYEDYRITLDRIDSLQSRIGQILDDLQNVYGPAAIEGGFHAVAAGVAGDLTELRNQLAEAQQHASDLRAQWEASDLTYGEYYLGPLENAGQIVSVRYGVAGENTSAMDRIHLGLIRWDQAVAGAQQQSMNTITNINGRWLIGTGSRQISSMVISGGSGTIDYFGNGVNPVTGVSYDPGTGRVSFTESDVTWANGAITRYVGTLTVHEDGRVFIVDGTMSLPHGDAAFGAELVEPR